VPGQQSLKKQRLEKIFFIIYFSQEHIMTMHIQLWQQTLHGICEFFKKHYTLARLELRPSISEADATVPTELD
jgi:hypothetical protein